MANIIYRNRLLNNVAHAIREAADAAAIEHPGLVGRIRELTIQHLLTPMLPAGFQAGTGKVVNSRGEQSGEVDITIYNGSILPPVLYSQRDGVFPSESTYYAIEVKSRLTAANLVDAIEKGRSVIRLTAPANPDPGRRNRSPTVLVLVAFGSDLAEGTSELDRYVRHEPEWQTDPVLKAICVVGRGYWYHRAEDNRWAFVGPTPDHDEVIDLVSGITNTLLKNPPTQRVALLGHYLSEDRPHLLIPTPDA